MSKRMHHCRDALGILRETLLFNDTDLTAHVASRAPRRSAGQMRCNRCPRSNLSRQTCSASRVKTSGRKHDHTGVACG